ncbi:hypothetical protein GDO78_015092 [Eleutherodactylus coqui]|uniref:G-protein coupled receptors family 1 profile domain-containing protein n=1 Tax=Eleutherodactylus coqui TaxID=57060 RepID=A0A8J6JPG7_ELECQ|nr:hypothetical protein GDO78_015092 [Eleutherodactylus coqui]
MQENNLTAVTEFFLLGFQNSQFSKIFLFCLFFVAYFGTICGNLLIITLVSTSKTLHTPMYFFISQLSISDMLVITDIVPNLLHILLNNGGAITFIHCMTQLYFLCAPEVIECFLLAVMSYDRYVAICNPFHYTSLMTHIYLLAIPIVFIPTTVIVVSYTCIVVAILRIQSNTGRHKAFSTCSSHLIVVSIFYGTLFTVYVVPKIGQTLTVTKILSLLYTVFTPLINPIIYSLRNKDIKKAVHETIHKHVIW